MANVLLSNKVISVVAALLLAGILLDGKLYNRLPQSTGIYSISAYPDVTVSKDNQTIMKFKHMDGRWHLTEPFVAPVHASRVQPLLDTNTQTLRSYELSELDNVKSITSCIRSGSWNRSAKCATHWLITGSIFRQTMFCHCCVPGKRLLLI
jgi:hypothetical protein